MISEKIDHIKKTAKKTCGKLLIIGMFLIILVMFVFLCSSEAEVKKLSQDAQESYAQIEGLENDLSQNIGDKNLLYNEKNSLNDVLAEKDNEIEALKENIDELILNIELLQKNIDILKDLPKIEDNFDKIAYLTFDDGPSNNTIKVLDILKKYHIKATFFVVYSKFGERNDVYNRILEEGHSLGNHTYDHTKAFKNWDNFLRDMQKMEDFLIEKTGEKTYLLRFPGGTSQNWYSDKECLEQIRLLRENGYQYFDWNVSTSDGGSNYVSSEEILDFVAGRSHGQDKIIVLMHDRSSKDSTIEALPDVIEYLRYKGYVFLPLTTQSYTRQFFDITQEDRLMKND